MNDYQQQHTNLSQSLHVGSSFLLVLEHALSWKGTNESTGCLGPIAQWSNEIVHVVAEERCNLNTAWQENIPFSNSDLTYIPKSSAVVQMRMAHTGLYVWIFGPSEWNYLGRMSRFDPVGEVWTCWRRSVTRSGFEVSKVRARPSLYLQLSDQM